ncbi:TetR/AcrR family transcriptional regulator [Ulvibacterium sp.]|uniref:TetR/AcrR family transcriptional regulator n=1 Tax=Ulvibacterium sp. TaxID=2665914 RepID=UPI00260D99F0|nr:TetR/AcrR family transcriptional regulator [Ulvibacterium sp.]
MTNSQFKMVATKKHLKPASRREQIINAADLVLLDVGVKDFTIDKVVEYLGIAKGTVYKYFQSKDDVLAEVSTKALNQLLNYFKMSERNSPDGPEKTKAVIMSCYHYSKDYPKYFELIVYLERPEFKTSAESHRKASTKIQEFFIGHIELQKEQGYFKKNINPMMMNYLCWGSSMGVMQFLDSKRAFLEQEQNISQEELMTSFVEVFVNGMTK